TACRPWARGRTTTPPTAPPATLTPENAAHPDPSTTRRRWHPRRARTAATVCPAAASPALATRWRWWTAGQPLCLRLGSRQAEPLPPRSHRAPKGQRPCRTWRKAQPVLGTAGTPALLT